MKFCYETSNLYVLHWQSFCTVGSADYFRELLSTRFFPSFFGELFFFTCFSRVVDPFACFFYDILLECVFFLLSLAVSFPKMIESVRNVS